MTKLRLYKCNALVFDKVKSKMVSSSDVLGVAITEYIFATTKLNATNIFNSRHTNNMHLIVSPIRVSSGLVICKNEYNGNIEDNELTISVDLERSND